LIVCIANSLSGRTCKQTEFIPLFVPSVDHLLCESAVWLFWRINLLKPTGYEMHQQV